MKRIIDHFLARWMVGEGRKPLFLRGARQVGKTYAVRVLGKKFEHFVEINLERNPQLAQTFTRDLDPKRIILELSAFTGMPIVPGKTLLFIDEVQIVPQAVTAMRYFYEELPELHVVAAGSLLDFTLEHIGMPVGRVESLYMYPLSFLEFLVAMGGERLAAFIGAHRPEAPLSEALHTKALSLLGQYLAVGGMPFVVAQWAQEQNTERIARLHHDQLDSYRQDFEKYARTKQVRYVELVFDQIPQQLGRKFKYSLIDGDYRKRELAPALDLLATAGVAHKVYAASAAGLPLRATIDVADYKALFLDIGLAQSATGGDVKGWFLDPVAEVVNKGALVEAFVGQELLVHAPAHQRESLCYWHKEGRAGAAEVDYVIQKEGLIVPIEVKAGGGSTLRSLHSFIEIRQSQHGVRFSAHNYSVHEKVVTIPLYAVAAYLSGFSLVDVYPSLFESREDV